MLEKKKHPPFFKKMVKLFEAITNYDYNPFREVNRSRAEKELRTLAKRANQRLLSLERAKSEVSGKSLSSTGAYQKYALPLLEAQGRRRFKEGGYSKMAYSEVADQIVGLQKFLSAKTSTVGGQKAAEASRIATFKSGKWGTHNSALGDTGGSNRAISVADTDTFYDFLNSRLYDDLKAIGISSDKIIEIYDELRESLSEEDIIERLDDAYGKFLEEREAGLSEFSDFLGISPFDM